MTVARAKRRARFDPATFVASDCADGRDAPERIRFIQYDGKPKLPCLVVTEPKGGGEHEYYFDRSERTGLLYWHLAGFGSRREEFVLSPFVEPRPPKAFVWAAPDLKLVMRGGRQLRTPAGYARLGYVYLDEPLRLPRWPRYISRAMTLDPFECCWAVHGDTNWCETCQDNVPDDDPCDHVWWCDEHGMPSTPSDRCGCPDPDAEE